MFHFLKYLRMQLTLFEISFFELIKQDLQCFNNNDFLKFY